MIFFVSLTDRALPSSSGAAGIYGSEGDVCIVDVQGLIERLNISRGRTALTQIDVFEDSTATYSTFISDILFVKRGKRYRLC